VPHLPGTALAGTDLPGSATLTSRFHNHFTLPSSLPPSLPPFPVFFLFYFNLQQCPLEFAPYPLFNNQPPLIQSEENVGNIYKITRTYAYILLTEFDHTSLLLEGK